MEYRKCYLYGLKSKKKLLELLHIDRKIYCKSSFLNCKIKPYIEVNKNKKKRLIEAPDEDVKNIQSIILRALQLIDVPNYAFSGIKGKCYIDNAKAHSDKKYLFKIDISKFFPNIGRNRIYNFYLNKLKTSPDVANILTNLSTINLDLKNQNNKTMLKINEFINDAHIKERNHLITGSPLSSIMSYFANVDMFEKINEIALKYHVTMTVYVDDVVFSSDNKIPYFFRKNILNIISQNSYDVSVKKCKWYNKPENKKVTGVILDKNGKMQIPNKLMLKTHNYINEINKGDKTNIDKLQGCLVVANSINGKFKEYRGQLKKMKRKFWQQLTANVPVLESLWKN